MCSKMQLAELTKEIVTSYEEIYGDDIVGIYLYGSYARGDFDDESDVDFVAIVRGERRELQDKLYSVWDRSSDIGSAFGLIISPTVVPYDEFETYRDQLPYYQNILKEGRKVG